MPIKDLKTCGFCHKVFQIESILQSEKKLVILSISFEISMLKSPAIKMLSYLFTA